MKKEIKYLGHIIDLEVTFNDSEESTSCSKLRHKLSYNIYNEVKIRPGHSVMCSTRYASGPDILMDIVKLEEDAMEYARNNSREPIDRSIVEQLRFIGFKNKKE